MQYITCGADESALTKRSPLSLLDFIPDDLHVNHFVLLLAFACFGSVSGFDSCCCWGCSLVCIFLLIAVDLLFFLFLNLVCPLAQVCTCASKKTNVHTSNMAAPSTRQWGVTPPISTVLPTPDEVAANDELVSELKAQNNFESPAETERR